MNKKITDLPELINAVDDALLYIVDISDLSEDIAGTSKKIKKSNLIKLPTLQQVTDTGNFTNKQIFINTALGTALGIKGTNYGIQSEGDWAGGFLFTDNGVGIVALSNNAVAGKFYIKNLTNNILECYYNDNTTDFLRFHVTAIGEANANAFIKNGGLTTEFLKADGSVDSSNYVAGSGTDTFLPKFNAGVLEDSRIKEEGNIVTFESNDIQSRIRLKNNAGGQIDIGLYGQYAYTFGQYFVFNDENFSYFKIFIANFGIGNAMRIANNGTMSLVPNNRLLVGTETDNGVDRLQINGNANISGILKTNRARISEDYVPTETPFYSEDFSIGLGDFTDGGGVLPWTRVTDEGNGDLFSAKSGAITHSQNTVLVLTKITTQDSTLLQFDYKVSTEQGYDFFYVEVNGIVVRRYSGTIPWTTDNIYIHGAGGQTIKFIYRKDVGDTAGSDSVWIDNVKLINAEESYVNYKPALYKDDLVVEGDLASKGLFSFKEFTGKKGTINESLIFNDINGKLFGFITPILNNGLAANFYNTNGIRGAQILSELTRTGINFNHPTTGAEAFKFQSNSVGVDFLQIPSTSALIRFGGTSNLDPTFMFRVTGKSLFLNNVLINTNVDNGVDKLQVTGSVNVTSDVKVGRLLQTKAYTVATLPAGVEGAVAYVTDGLSPTYRGIATGGGTEKCLVFFNGTNWLFH